jgi:hypothetical protein
MIDIVEIEGGVSMSIRLRDKRFGVVRYHVDDDGEVAAAQDCGWFDTPSGAAVRVVAALRQATVTREGAPFTPHSGNASGPTSILRT